MYIVSGWRKRNRDVASLLFELTVYLIVTSAADVLGENRETRVNEYTLSVYLFLCACMAERGADGVRERSPRAREKERERKRVKRL